MDEDATAPTNPATPPPEPITASFGEWTLDARRYIDRPKANERALEVSQEWISVILTGPGKKKPRREYRLSWNGERFAESATYQDVIERHPNALEWAKTVLIEQKAGERFLPIYDWAEIKRVARGE